MAGNRSSKEKRNERESVDGARARRNSLGIVNFRCNVISIRVFRMNYWPVPLIPCGWVYLVQPLTTDYPLHPTSGVSLRRQHYILHILYHLVALCSCNVLSFGMRNDEKSLHFAKLGIRRVSCHHV